MSKLRNIATRPIPLVSLIGAFIFGAVSWYVLSYWRRLLGLPPIVKTRQEGRVEAYLSQQEKAIQIASANVRAGIEKRTLPDGRRRTVLCAGMRNFREPWARDFSFAGFGLMELNELRAMRETLEVFFINQTESGQFPVKVHSTNIFDRFLISLFGRQQPVDPPIRPKYVTAHNTISLDGNALIVIAALLYLQKVEDKHFYKKNWQGIVNGLNWLENHALTDDGLLSQAAYTDWADSVSRVGKVLYTNVLYWKALHDCAVVAEKYGDEIVSQDFLTRSRNLKSAINDHFWRDELGYYITSRQFELLNSDGNLLAVAWDLSTEKQGHAILNNVRDMGMADPVPTQVTDQPYGSQYIAIENRLGGIPHYHTSAAWLWLGGWHVVALVQTGRLKESKELLERMDKVIVRDGVVHEVYGKDGQPLKSFWYTSEAPLTWSAGVFVYAHSVYKRGIEKKRQEEDTFMKDAN